MLPVGYEPSRHYPLIVVQYETRGFLRGGAGDEHPIQVFANRGYAVLSFGRPEIFGLRGNPRDLVELNRNNLTGFADRRSVHSSLEQGVRSLIDRGIANPSRIGITGLSDGASTIEFALIRSNLFAAVAMSHAAGVRTFRFGSARRPRDISMPKAIRDLPRIIQNSGAKFP